MNPKILNLAMLRAFFKKMTIKTVAARYPDNALENEKLARQEYSQGKLILESLPSRVTFALTTFCNNKTPCLICDRNVRASSADSECNERTIRAMLPLLKTTRILRLHSGGEAMFSKHFDSILKMVQPPTRISFATNAMLLTSRRAELMLERDVMDGIVVSLDAATQETYRIMRPSCDFDTVTRNIYYYTELANELGRKESYVDLNMAICRTNIRDVPKLVDLAVQLGARRVSYQRLNTGLKFTVPTIESREWSYVDESRIEPALSNEMVLEAYYSAKSKGIKISFSGAPFLDDRTGNIDSAICEELQGTSPVVSEGEWESTFHKPTGAPLCFSPWREVSILPDGEVRLCCFHDYPRCSLGNILEGDFMNIWNSPSMIKQRKDFLEKGFSFDTCGKSPGVCIHRGRS